MTLTQNYEKDEFSIQEFPGILIVEPSKLPIYRFDCEIIEEFAYFKRGDKIKVDVLPVELGNKLVLYIEEEKGNRIEIKLSQIKDIDTTEGEKGFMDKKKLLVEILLENNSNILLFFEDYKIKEFISLVNSFYQIDNTYWKFVEIEYSEGDHFGSTKIYFNTPFLAKGENLFWSFVGMEGVLDKKATFVMAITNFRVIIYYFDSHECECVLFSDLDEISVMNSRKAFQSFGSRSFSSKDSSQTIGDVVFIKNDKRAITFGQMEDPQGLADLAKSIKKNSIFRNKPSINYS